MHKAGLDDRAVNRHTVRPLASRSGDAPGGRARTSAPPARATAVSVGMASGASRGPNQSSNMGTSSPARRWKIPSGHPLATSKATPSPVRTPMETPSQRSRRRVKPQVHR